MSPRILKRIGVAALTTALVTALSVPAMSVAAAPIAGTTVITASSTVDPRYKTGRAYTGLGATAKIGVASLTKGVVVVRPGDKPGDPSYTFTLTPGLGQRLQPGRFVIPPNVYGPDDLTASIAIGSTNVGFTGDVDILDLAADSRGDITRFDIIFRSGISTPENAFFGQIRMGQATDTGAVLSSTSIRYPDTPVGSSPIWMRQTITNTSSNAFTVGATALTSGAKGDFRIGDNTCLDKRLEPGARCSMNVGFDPTRGGPRTGTFSVKTGTKTKTFSVAGESPRGKTGFTYRGDDPISAGRSHSFQDGPRPIGLNLLPWGWTFTPGSIYAEGIGADTATVSVGRHDDGPIETGTFVTSSGPTTSSGLPARYELSVSGSGRACGFSEGRVTISKWEVDDSGFPSSVAFSWTHKCAGDEEEMTGSLQWRDRSDTTAPASVTGLELSTVGGVTTATWHGSSSTDSTNAIARIAPADGALALPTSGRATTRVSSTQAVLPVLPAGGRYTLLVWSLDGTGNVGRPATITINS